ncbi:MAG: TetR/AcrR family transcriptional regulator [Gammaproteobacteria bacterium]|nr:TetR/AcrR family transcriptional regulator [Gammaproteobacteria bacterium]MDH3363357.1 TetR/AcrR family transcriptional regulator [Gammaproteobacteria bacterium]
MDAFWAKGYEATSMADLCCCTGLHKGSLYQAFGDKHTLFMDALHHYANSEFHETTSVMKESNTPLENLRAVVNRVVEDAAGEKGCMMINSMVELAPHDRAVKAALQGFGQQRMRAITGMIAMAQESGELSAAKAPDKLARQLMMTMAGGAAMVKGLVTPEAFVETINDLIDSWV